MILIFQVGVFNTESKTWHILPPENVRKMDCHKIEICLEINRNNDPYLYQEPKILPKIKNLPQTLKNKKIQKIPIVGFFDNSSIICIWNQNKNYYDFSKGWNGKFRYKVFCKLSKNF